MELILFVRNLSTGIDKEFHYHGSYERDEVMEAIQKHIGDTDFEVVDFWVDDQKVANNSKRLGSKPEIIEILLVDHYTYYQYNFKRLFDDFDLMEPLNEDEIINLYLLTSALGYDIEELVSSMKNGNYTIFKGTDLQSLIGEYFENVRGIKIYEHPLSNYLMDDEDLFKRLKTGETLEDCDKDDYLGIYYIVL